MNWRHPNLRMRQPKNLAKTDLEIHKMREAGRAAARTLGLIEKYVRPGITTLSLDNAVGEILASLGAESAFLGYRGFPRQCCISINEQVLHGIGGQRVLQYGDVVKIDVGIQKGGFIGDVAKSFVVGGVSPEIQKLLDITESALHSGISQVRDGCRISDISKAIQSCVERSGYSVVREFVGHGVGRNLHEEPQIPNFFSNAASCSLVRGMTIAIEPMVNAGQAAVEVLKDGWTVVTRDRKMSAHFEHTVLVTETGAEILTQEGDFTI